MKDPDKRVPEEGYGLLIKLANDCERTQSAIAWRNKKFTFEVCGDSEADARSNINDSLLQRKLEAAADQALGDLGCDEVECRGDNECVEQDVVLQNPRITTPPYNFRDTGNRGDCPEGKTVWTFDIRLDVQATKRCDCQRPS